MAKKRLNKKVAIVGLAAFLVLGVAGVWVIGDVGERLIRNPQKFIDDGDAAALAKDYETAAGCYGRARSLAKTDSLRIEILFKAADMYIEAEDWPKVMSHWRAITEIDLSNTKALLGLLKYYYIIADNGMSRAWSEVVSQATKLLDKADASLLATDISDFGSFGMEETDETAQLGPYLHLLRGRATLEITRMGATTKQDESLTKAVNDLKKVLSLDPDNIDAYWYLAQTLRVKAEFAASQGSLEQKKELTDQALKLLEQSIRVAENDPRPYVNLLMMKLDLARTANNRAEVKEQVKALEGEHLSLVEKFPSSPLTHLTLARFYAASSVKSLDKAIESTDKVIELEPDNVLYALNAAVLHFRKFAIYGEAKHIHEAVRIAKNAITLPNAQDVPGPREGANRRNKFYLYDFLANSYVEQLIRPDYSANLTESERDELIRSAEQAIHEIEQLHGSKDNVHAVKWQGMLDLAKGDTNSAVRKMYTAYEQLKSVGNGDSVLSYRLAKIFEKTDQIGAAREFFESAFINDPRSGKVTIVRTRPQALLDYTDILLRLGAYGDVLRALDFFEVNYWTDERTKQTRVNTHILAGQFEEAEKELSTRDPDDPNSIKLKIALIQAKIRQVRRAAALQRKEGDGAKSPDTTVLITPKEELLTDESVQAELRSHMSNLAELVEKLTRTKLDVVESSLISLVCNGHYIPQGKIKEAKDLVDRFLRHSPDDEAVLFCKQILSEPIPGEVDQQRHNEIEERLLSDISDPVKRSVNLGAFYQRTNKLDKAIEEYKKVVSQGSSPGTSTEQATDDEDEQTMSSRRFAASRLFDMALMEIVSNLSESGNSDKMEAATELANEVKAIATRDNLDGCEGHLFTARLAMAKEDYETALRSIDECLKHRPVFGNAYMMRSTINNALGNEQAAAKDIRKAATQSPLDGNIARRLANTLYLRNRNLGRNVSSAQKIEAREALDRAMRLNPKDIGLQSFYAEYISDEEPERALAIRQRLQQFVPTVENAYLLGRMAVRMALKETNSEEKQALFDIAGSSFEQALAIAPQNKNVLDGYVEYCRLTDQKEKIEQVLAKSQDQRLRWMHYVRDGRFEDAGKVLEKLYTSDPNDGRVVEGLLFVAERIGDTNGIMRYSEELVSLNGSIKNYLLQVQTLLRSGLVNESEHKLQRLKEKYPDEPGALLLEAWLTMKQGKLEKALESITKNLEADQSNATAWRLKGEINLLTADYQKAISDLKKSQSLSDNPNTRISLAKAYLRANRKGDAITELKNAINQPQTPIEARRLLEQVYLRSDNKAELRKFYDQTLEKLPDSTFWYKRAGALALRENKLARAEELYRQAWEKSISKGPGDASALDGYLGSLVLSGKLDKALKEGGKHADDAFAPIALYRMGEAKLKLRDKEGAIRFCRNAIDKAGKNDAAATNALQKMSSLLGTEEAEKYCNQRLQANPDSLVANYAMFNLKMITGKYNNALDYIDKCLQIEKSDNNRRIRLSLGKARVLQMAYSKTADNNYLNKVITEYESLLVKMPTNLKSGVLNNLAYLLAENDERLADALDYAERAYELKPNDPGFLDTYAYVLHKNGKNTMANEYLTRSLQLYEQDKISAPAEVYEHLGMIKEQIKEIPAALAAYQQALEIGKETLPETVRKRIEAAIERLLQAQKNGN